MGIAFAAALAFAASAALQRPFIRYAERAMLDRPNERSSHSRPTPRGGGAVAVGVYLLLAAAFLIKDDDALPEMLALAAILIVAAVGWIDDRRSLGVRTRLATHMAAGVLMVPLAMNHPPAGVPAVLLAGAVALLTVVSINVLNFMDGIDGLIASQVAIFAALGLLNTPTGVAGMHSGILLGATVGFLVWNWPPARIFLGDVGSGALGAACVLAGLLAPTQTIAGLWVAYLPLTPILVDATVTLLRRALRGEHLATAHRQHLYQRLANGGWGHRRVTVAYGLASLAALPITASEGSQASAGVGYLLIVMLIGWVLDRRYPMIRPGMHGPVSASERQ